MSISLEEIISLVVKEVILELSRRGIQVDNETVTSSRVNMNQQKIKLGLMEYKTPLLTEAHILNMDSKVIEIEVPLKTLITPSAIDLIRERKMIITKK